MKKFLSLMLSVLLVFSTMSTIGVVATTSSMTISSANAEPGDTVELTLSLQASSVKSYAFTLADYDTTALELTGYEVVSVGSPTLASWDEARNNLGAAYSSNVAVDGVILKLTFLVKNDAEPGTYVISGSKAQVDRTDVTLIDGSISLPKYDFDAEDVTWEFSPEAISYGDALSAAVELPTSGVVTVNGKEYTGTFSLENGTETPAVGTAKLQVTFTVNDEDAGKFNDASVTKEFDVTVNKAACAETAIAPELTATDTTVMVTDAVNGQEYAITTEATEPTANWNDTGVFTDLAPDTAYTVYTRVKETATHEKSESVTATITTDKAEQIITVANPTPSVRVGGTLDLSTLCTSNAEGAVLVYTVDGDLPEEATLENGVITAGAVTGTITVKINSDAVGGYYAADEATITVSIVVKETDDSTMTVTQEGCTYGEALADFVLNGEPVHEGDHTVLYTGTLANGDPYSSAIKPTEAGTYKVTVVCETDDTIYTAISDDFTIAKADYTDLEVALAPQTEVYEGREYDYLDTNITVPDGVSYEITYSATPLNAGEYTVTVTFTTSNENYNNPAELTTTLTITQAVATGYNLNADVPAELSAAANILTEEDLATELGLPAEIYVEYVQYENGSSKDPIAVTWALEEDFDAKGGSYTFVGTLADNDNIDTSELDVEVPVTLTAVEGTFTAIEDYTLPKAAVIGENVIDMPDIAPYRITVNYGNEQTDLVIVWDKDLAAVQAIAAQVTETTDKTVELTIADETFADIPWVTIVGDKTHVITITSKTPATATLSDVASVTYGEAIEAPTYTWTVNGEEGTTVESADLDATVTITYKAEDGTIYNDVADVKAAGNYVVVATFDSAIYSGGTIEKAFTIAKKDVAVTAIDLAGETATINGNLEQDALGIDFDVIDITITDKTVGAGKATVSNIVLTGDAASNYNLTNTVLENVDIEIAAAEAPAEGTENDVTITVSRADGNAAIIVVDQAALDAIEEDTEAASIDMTENETETTETVIVPYELVDKLIATRPVSITLTEAVVEFSRDVLSHISTALGASVDMHLDVKPATLTEAQLDVIPEDATNVTAVELKINDGAVTTFGTGNKVKVKIPYVKDTGRIKAKYIDDLGNEEAVSVTHDGTYAILEVEHFSDYVVYTEPNSTVRPSSGVSKPAQYTVTFESNGGSDVAAATVIENAVIAEPIAPTKDGFEFEGWYTDAELTQAYDFAAKVAKSFTLYAKWAEEASGEEPVVTFADVVEGAWYYDAVMAANEAGLMNGVSETEFAPDAAVTRAMFVTVLHRLSGDTMDTKDIAFSDVSADSYYASAVAWAKRNEIVNGVTENEFAPDSNITREQMATMLYRYAKAMGMDVAVGEDAEVPAFSDTDSISEYAVDAIEWACANGIMGGNADGTIAPLANATRAELATVFVRFTK